MQRSIDGLGGRRRHAGNGGQLLHGGVLQRVHRDKAVEQSALALVAHALYLVQAGVKLLLPPKRAVVADGKAVRLVADALQQLQRGVVPAKGDRLLAVGQIDQLLLLGKADGGDVRKPPLL